MRSPICAYTHTFFLVSSTGLFVCPYFTIGFPSWLSGKEHTCQCRRHRFDPWVGNFHWRRKWQSTPVFLPGKIPWIEELDGLQSTGLQRAGHEWAHSHKSWVAQTEERPLEHNRQCSIVNRRISIVLCKAIMVSKGWESVLLFKY